MPDYLTTARAHISRYVLNRYFWVGAAVTAMIAFAVKGELVLGLIVGGGGLWFASHDKQRFEIYKEKIRAYRQIQLALSNVYESSFTDSDLYNRACQELFQICNQNYIFISSEAVADAMALSLLKFPGPTDAQRQELAQLYDSTVMHMSIDLDITRLHGMSLTLHRIGDFMTRDRAYSQTKAARADNKEQEAQN